MVTGIGNTNVDFILHTASLPRPGESLRILERTMMSGGKVSNQACAASRLGADASIITLLGALDGYNSVVQKSHEWAGLNTNSIEYIPGVYSGNAFIIVSSEAGSENCIFFSEGAGNCFSREFIDRHAEAVAASDICLYAFEIPEDALLYSMQLSSEHGAQNFLNPSPYREFSPELIKYTDVLLVNEVEAADICGTPVTEADSAHRAARLLHEMGFLNIVLTLGSKGALISDGTQTELLPSHKVAAKDTSGAGDCFTGALAAALDGGSDLFSAARFASAAAAISVTRTGTIMSVPTRDEVLALLKLS